jgi:hypothetical protein
MPWSTTMVDCRRQVEAVRARLSQRRSTSIRASRVEAGTLRAEIVPQPGVIGQTIHNCVTGSRRANAHAWSPVGMIAGRAAMGAFAVAEHPSSPPSD